MFNHGGKAVDFQKAWLTEHSVETVLNLADYRLFLFEKAIHPAIVVRYRPERPTSLRRKIEYLAPKVDWAATQAEIISVSPIDRSCISLAELVKDWTVRTRPRLGNNIFGQRRATCGCSIAYPFILVYATA